MVDPEIIKVFAKIMLLLVNANELDYEYDGVRRINGFEPQEKLASFVKTLVQSEVLHRDDFPRFDYLADPPMQTILAKDVHGETWKFRHIYRGTLWRHLLMTGWSTFVNHKKLVAGDSIVFLKVENEDLYVRIRQVKRGIGGGPEMVSGWNLASEYYAVPYRGFPNTPTPMGWPRATPSSSLGWLPGHPKVGLGVARGWQPPLHFF
jgi:hypothetical protein